MGGRTVQWTLQRKIPKLRCRLLYNWSELKFCSHPRIILQRPQSYQFKFSAKFFRWHFPCSLFRMWWYTTWLATWTQSLHFFWEQPASHLARSFPRDFWQKMLLSCPILLEGWRLWQKSWSRYISHQTKLSSNKATTTGSSSSDQLWPWCGPG